MCNRRIADDEHVSFPVAGATSSRLVDLYLDKQVIIPCMQASFLKASSSIDRFWGFPSYHTKIWR